MPSSILQVNVVNHLQVLISFSLISYLNLELMPTQKLYLVLKYLLAVMQTPRCLQTDKPFYITKWRFFGHFLVLQCFVISTWLTGVCERSAGMKDLVSLNVANSKVTNAGLQHLRPLTSLTSLALQGCKVTLPAVERLQTTSLPNLTVIRLHPQKSSWPCTDTKRACAVLLLMAILSSDLGEESARWTSGNLLSMMKVDRKWN